MKKKWIVILVVLLAVVAGGVLFFVLSRPKPVVFRTIAVERRDLALVVTASGTVNPVTSVVVGTQVSGTVAKLFADFNSPVKAGQVVALLDTTFLAASVMDAKATMNKTDAQLTLTKQTTHRTRQLFEKGLVAQADLDQAVSDSVSAAANLISAVAQYERAKINLQYATIVSPISGIVTARSVDLGQTVAASFSTPAIFTIAADLKKMQVQASIDEADIGQVKVGQNATFTVDAYPARSFSGIVSQIRLQPTTTQNVVVYTVMVDVDNKDMALLPGMTANITVEIQKIENVLVVPDAALAFMPPMFGRGNGKWHSNYQQGNAPHDSASTGGETPHKHGGFAQHDSTATGMHHYHDHGNVHDTTAKAQTAARIKTDDSTAVKPSRVFVLTDKNRPKPVFVRILLASGGYSAVDGDLAQGQQVIVGILSGGSKPKTAASSQLMGGGGTPGMPRRF